MALGAGFKRCCLKSGDYDGSNRHYFFPRVERKPAIRREIGDSATLSPFAFLFTFSAGWQFIAGTGPLAASASHEFVKSLEVSTSFPAGEELRRLHGGELFRHCRGHELIDARPIFFALLLHCFF